MNDCAANKALVKKLFDEWINKKNLAAIDGMVTPNYVSHEGGEDANAEDTKKFLAGLFRSSPDIHVTIEDIVCEGDKVVVRNIWRATDMGGFGGRPPTGKSVVVEGFVMWRIENGKLAERWAVIDYRGLMQQLSTTSQSK
jgi:predicted ester cyclase